MGTRARGRIGPGGASRFARAAFTLTEILVATFLLSGSLIALTTIWSLSRRVTETSRDTAEYYAIARQEIERDRALGFDAIFNSPTFSYATPRYTDYDETGKPANEPPRTPARYRAKSQYYLVRTGNGPQRQSDVDDPQRRLGIQIIKIYPILRNGGEVSVNEAEPPRYQTTMLFALTGV